MVVAAAAAVVVVAVVRMFWALTIRQVVGRHCWAFKGLLPSQANDMQSSAQSPSSSGGGGAGSGVGGSSNDQFASLMEKKIAEVEMGLLHLQQNIDIPEINLIIHPSVAQIVKKCADEQRKPRTDDYSDKAEDANFLNQLQSGVSRWIREIKKVIYIN